MNTEKLVTGTFATIFTVSMQLPQIYHSLKTKKTKDISMIYLFLCILNHIAWLVYAIFDNMNLPLLICDGVSICLTLFLICIKYYYDKQIVTVQ